MKKKSDFFREIRQVGRYNVEWRVGRDVPAQEFLRVIRGDSMPRAKDELQELAEPLGFEVHYGSRKIWINRPLLGGRFSRSFLDKGEGGEFLRNRVIEWIKMWGPVFNAFDFSVTKENSCAPAYSIGFKENK